MRATTVVAAGGRRARAWRGGRRPRRPPSRGRLFRACRLRGDGFAAVERTLLTGLLAFVCVLVSGCGANTPLPDSITSPPPGNVQMVEVMGDMEAARGQRVRWGGSVVEVVVESSGATRIEILERKLDASGQPLNHGPSDGRFAIRASPEVNSGRYSLGSEVTVAGQLQGSVVASTGELIPLLLVADFVRWIPPLPPYYYYDDPLYGRGPWGYGPWYNDRWYPYYGPRRRLGIRR